LFSLAMVLENAKNQTYVIALALNLMVSSYYRIPRRKKICVLHETVAKKYTMAAIFALG